MTAPDARPAPLDGRVAVVTGGGSGIGEATCVRLARDGALVVVFDVDPSAAELSATVCGGRAVVGDVADSEQVDDAADEIVREYGRLDIWVNNAGVPSTDGFRRRVENRTAQRLREAENGEAVTTLDALVSVDDAEWRRMIDIHLCGTFYGTRAAARAMTPARRGAIVNVSSICGIAGCESHPHYSAAKAGIIGLTRAAAKELVVVGIRVNAVAPGYIDTPISRRVPDAVSRAIRGSVPAGRLGTPAEIAATIAYLVHDDAGYVVGQVISPNGGLLTAS